MSANSANSTNQPWTVANAKARLSEVIERAQVEPQTITRNGRPSVVIVSIEEWDRKTARKGSLGQFLIDSPLAGSSVEANRDVELARDAEL